MNLLRFIWILWTFIPPTEDGQLRWKVYKYFAYIDFKKFFTAEKVPGTFLFTDYRTSACGERFWSEDIYEILLQTIAFRRNVVSNFMLFCKASCSQPFSWLVGPQTIRFVALQNIRLILKVFLNRLHRLCTTEFYDSNLFNFKIKFTKFSYKRF